jgi:hypothetical protein
MEAEVVVHDGDVFQEFWRTKGADVAIHTARVFDPAQACN